MSEVKQDPRDYGRRTETFHLLDVAISPTVTSRRKQISELCNENQAIAIYRIDFHCDLDGNEASTQTVMSVNPEYQTRGHRSHRSAANVQSNNVLAGVQWSKNAVSYERVTPSATQIFNPPRPLAMDFYIKAIKYGGSITPNCYVTIYYKVFDCSPMERAMIRRFYG